MVFFLFITSQVDKKMNGYFHCCCCVVVFFLGDDDGTVVVEDNLMSALILVCAIGEPSVSGTQMEKQMTIMVGRTGMVMIQTTLSSHTIPQEPRNRRNHCGFTLFFLQQHYSIHQWHTENDRQTDGHTHRHTHTHILTLYIEKCRLKCN